MNRMKDLLRGSLCLLSLFLMPFGGLEARSVLNFPFLTFEKDTITGVAIVNLGEEDAQVEVTAYISGGQLLQGEGIENPVALEVKAGTQSGTITVSLFGSGPELGEAAWFQAVSETDGLTGFFLYLDTASSFLDGADLPSLSSRLIFSDVRVGEGESTELNLINPTGQAVTAEVKLVSNEDSASRMLNLPPRGAARLDVEEFFSQQAAQAPAGVARRPLGNVIEGLTPAGVTVDRCTGDIYVSDSASGEVRKVERLSGAEVTVAEDLADPGQLLGLYRSGITCGESFHLLITERGADRILILTSRIGPEPWVSSPGIQDLALRDTSQEGAPASVLPDQPGILLGEVTKQVGQVALVPMDLYEGDAINPVAGNQLLTGIVGYSSNVKLLDTPPEVVGDEDLTNPDHVHVFLEKVLTLNQDLTPDTGQVIPAGSRIVSLWENGSFLLVGALFPAGVNARPTEINNQGQITGFVDDQAVLVSGETLSFLGSPIGGPSVGGGFCLNNVGQVAGGAEPVGALPAGLDATLSAVVWLSGPGSGQIIADGALALDINDSTQVIYTSLSKPGPRAFLWENGTATELGTLGGFASQALGLNNPGQVVGSSFTSQGAVHAFLWSDGQMIDLNDRIGSAPVVLTLALEITDGGIILCQTGRDLYILTQVGNE